ncbi:MAG: acyl-CoA synthetase [Bacteroidota bacterium]
MINLIENASKYKDRRAINSNGNSYSYTELLTASESVAVHLLNGRVDLEEARIAFLVTPSFEYVQLQWGIWRAGGIAVPLCTKHPLPSTQYVLEDTQAEVVIYSKEYETMLRPLISNSPHQFIPFESIIQKSGNLPDVELSRRAMILYTSGTTGNPKGVVSTHQNIEYQVTALTTSWEWQQDDHILNVLPMHHVHGIVNVTLCTLWSGACCEFLPKFDSGAVFNIFRKKEVNLFMAVPTIYFKLISYWNNLPQDEQEAISNALKDFRLMVSGSAALPISVLEKWRSISGHILLERYGMTEMGMAISNPYRGERKPGYIGQALTNVTIRIANENNQVVEEGASGEIQVKGPNIFKEYWQKPEATQKTFTEDGWFKTGDIAVFEEGSYRILGRNSVDIIKSGGYKISALEIEEVLRSHPKIKECGVVGIPDDEWGEIIGASLILGAESLDLEELKDWLKDRLPRYQLPRKYIFQDDLPRNVMGKVTKNELKKMF